MWERLIRLSQVLLRHLQIPLLAALTAGLVIGAYTYLGLGGDYYPVARVESLPQAESDLLARVLAGEERRVLPTDTSIKVSVTGSITKPGVYQLKGGSTVQDLLTVAGGLRKDADKAYVNKQINLAYGLQSGQQLYIPSATETNAGTVAVANPASAGIITSTPAPTTSTTGSSPTPASNGLINLNSASQAQLETLPGVGPSLAQKIIAARPYTSISQLDAVSGIGETTYNNLKDLVTI